MTTTPPSSPLAGLRVFVVDDEALVAMLLEDMLSDLGCVVVATAGRVDQALEMLGDPATAFDLAVLDVNVAGESILPVAAAVEARGASMVFATGYGQSGVPAPFRDRPTLQKPFGFNEVADRLVQAAARRSDVARADFQGKAET